MLKVIKCLYNFLLMLSLFPKLIQNELGKLGKFLHLFVLHSLQKKTITQEWGLYTGRMNRLMGRCMAERRWCWMYLLFKGIDGLIKSGGGINVGK